MLKRAIGYYRVSTDPQAATGFSLEGQRNAVHRYISDEGMDLVAEYTEAETAFRSSKITLRKTTTPPGSAATLPKVQGNARHRRPRSIGAQRGVHRHAD